MTYLHDRNGRKLYECPICEETESVGVTNLVFSKPIDYDLDLLRRIVQGSF